MFFLLDIHDPQCLTDWCCVLQDPHDSQRANSGLLPEDSAASEVLPPDVRGDGEE